MGNSKGDRGERELRSLFRDRGFAVIRAAGSGSAPFDELPDLHVADGEDELAIEAKRKDGNSNEYLTEEEVEALQSYSGLFVNSKAKVAIRWDEDMTWYFADPEDLPETPSGNRRLDPDARDADYYTTLDDLLEGTNS